MAKRQKLVKCEIRWDKAGNCWYFREMDGALWRRGFLTSNAAPDNFTKPRFIKLIVAELKTRIAHGAFGRRYGFSLRIYSQSGRVQEERTYPRSADPKSKG